MIISPPSAGDPTASLATAINEQHEACRQHASAALAHAIRAGELLHEAKAHVRHGDWLGWLRENCVVPERTAQLYMRLAAGRQQLAGADPQRVALLSVRMANRLLRSGEPETTSPLGQARTETEAWDRRHQELRVLVADAHRRQLELERAYPASAETVFAWVNLQADCQRWQDEAAEIAIRAERRIGGVLNESPLLANLLHAVKRDWDAAWDALGRRLAELVAETETSGRPL
jgi:Protein of unknown function (DUF3102)